jgi:hypothetical protein
MQVGAMGLKATKMGNPEVSNTTDRPCRVTKGHMLRR